MTKIIPPMSEREIRGAQIARKAASQGMVLLENRNETLPIKQGKIALFGNGAMHTIRGGTGSGDPFNGGLSGGGDEHIDDSPRYHIQILDAFLSEGFEVLNSEALKAYSELYEAGKETIQNRVMQAYAFPEEVLKEEELAVLSENTDMAVVIISRNAGEGNDRARLSTMTFRGMTYELGDYCLSTVEKENLKNIRRFFRKMLLILNVGGPIQVNDFKDAGADAILLMSQAGQEGGSALLDVLTGRVNPSGKLTATWAKNYEDYPSAKTFLSDPDTALYEEGIFVGYRYFDTWKIQAGYPFGYGLSYTTFDITDKKAYTCEDSIVINVTVKNTGKVCGREVVQIYVSAPDTILSMPEKELKGFAKTKELKPDEEENLTITISLRSCASYHEAQQAYVLSEGSYVIFAGTSSADTVPVCRFEIKETVPVELAYPEMSLKEALTEINAPHYKHEISEEIPELLITKMPSVLDSRSIYQDEKVITYTTDPEYQAVMPYEEVCLVEKRKITLMDVLDGNATLPEFTAQLSPLQLAELVCGTGWGVSDQDNPVIGGSSESVPGAAGETTHTLEELGVQSIVLADGPGGVRITQIFEATDLDTGNKRTVYHYCTAWPVGTLLAQSFDLELIEEVGRGMAEDMVDMNIALILGPGINIQRNPLCGRNFEYFSEDPFLTGKMAAAMTSGIQSIKGCGACIKHYAANNQETNRATINSVIGQRALREIYLEPYKIAIREGKPLSMMTSYNLINSVPTADSFDLCTNFARGECGFEGLIMTDWNGGSSTPYISMHAGNDLIMPGGGMRVRNIVTAVAVMEPEFDQRGQVDMTPPMPFLPVGDARWNSFILDEEGTETIKVDIGSGHTTEVKNDLLYVDGEPLYTRAQSMLVMRKDRSAPVRLDPASVKVASFSEDGTAIFYKGRYNSDKKICLGDIQRCAMNNLNVIMETCSDQTILYKQKLEHKS